MSDTLCIPTVTGLLPVTAIDNYKVTTDKNKITIDFGEVSNQVKTIRLTDQQGKLMKEISTTENKIEITVPIISTGIYFLNVIQSNSELAKARKIFLATGN